MPGPLQEFRHPWELFDHTRFAAHVFEQISPYANAKAFRARQSKLPAPPGKEPQARHFPKQVHHHAPLYWVSHVLKMIPDLFELGACYGRWTFHHTNTTVFLYSICDAAKSSNQHADYVRRALANNLRNVVQALNGTAQHTNPGHARTVRKGSGLSARQYRNHAKLARSFDRLCRDLEQMEGYCLDDLDSVTGSTPDMLVTDGLRYRGSVSGTARSASVPNLQQVPRPVQVQAA